MQIEKIVDALKNSRNPLIAFGQGVRYSDAVKEFNTLLEYY